ncbi:hypothetical protein PG995_014297 [Apiospora arundinis]
MNSSRHVAPGPCDTADQGPVAPAAPPPTPGSFTCRECGRTFARQEHLSRHLLSRHTKDRPFRCAACSKRFSRLDSLQRHRAAIHSTENTQNGSPHPEPVSDRACVKCASCRVRCSKTLPCRRCAQKGLLCEYPPGAISKVKSSNTGSEEAPGWPVELRDHADNHVSVDPLDLVTPNSLTTSPVTMEWMQSPWGYGMTQGQLTADATHSMDGLQFSSSLNWMSPSAGDSFDLNYDYLSSYNVGGINALGMPILPSYDNLDNMGLNSGPFGGNKVVPTAPTEMAGSPEVLERQPSRISGVSVSHGIVSPHHDEDDPSFEDGEPSRLKPQTVSQHTRAGTYYVDGAGARAPFKGQSSNRRVSFTGDMILPGPGMTAVPSYSLAADLSSTYGAWISDESFATLTAKIQAQSNRESSPRSLGAPTISSTQFKSFVLRYFLKFHPVFPFLRTRISCVPWFLGLAVTTLGAMHGATKSEYEIANTLLRILQRAAHVRLEKLLDEVTGPIHGTQATDPMGEDNLAILQGTVLATLAVLHHGNAGSVKDTMLLWTRLIQVIQLMGPCNKLGELAKDAPVAQWVSGESKARMLLMIWYTDMVISNERFCKPMMRFTDVLTLPLPLFDDSWDAPSRQQVAWANTRRVKLSEAIEMLYMEKRLPQHLGEFGAVLLVQAVCRRSQDALSDCRSQLLTWNPTSAIQTRQDSSDFEESWPPTDTLSARWRNSACDCLDILHWSANSKIARSSGWEHPTVLQLHFARLVLLTPSKHLDTIATVGLDTCSKDRLSESSSHILHWAVRDRFKARLSVIHAGALFWHVRRYSTGSMLEPYAVYLSTLVLWAYSNATLASKRRNEQASSDQTHVYREETSSRAMPYATNNDERSTASSAHTPTEIPSPESLELDDELTFIHLDRPLDDEAVQTFVRLGDKITGNLLRVGDISSPGAPRLILLEGIHLLVSSDSGKRATARDSSIFGNRAIQNNHHSQSSDTAEYAVWGVAHSYAASLRRLMETATSATRVAP